MCDDDRYRELCSLLELPSLRASECYRAWTPLGGRHGLWVRLGVLLAAPLARMSEQVGALPCRVGGEWPGCGSGGGGCGWWWWRGR